VPRDLIGLKLETASPKMLFGIKKKVRAQARIRAQRGAKGPGGLEAVGVRRRRGPRDYTEMPML
jgi:hypothetical protein